jgi:hypothetical protein
MAELKFTHHFKCKLADGLVDYFLDHQIHLEVKTEYRIKVGNGEDRIDIAVINPKDENRIVGIELEVILGKGQIFVNYDKFRRWTHASSLRKGALLHIITSNSNIYQRDVYELLEKSYDDARKDLGFFYEFFYLNVDDYRKFTEASRTLVEENWDFDARLFALIGQVFGKRFLNF